MRLMDKLSEASGEVGITEKHFWRSSLKHLARGFLELLRWVMKLLEKFPESSGVAL